MLGIDRGRRADEWQPDYFPERFFMKKVLKKAATVFRFIGYVRSVALVLSYRADGYAHGT